MAENPFITLKNDIPIPQLGFGTYGLSGATQAILHALQTGYRHLDTADIYATHENIAAAIAQSGLDRHKVFITTKLWSNSVSAQRVGTAVDRFLKELCTEYIDLLLIHWPARTPAVETLAAMDAARKVGKVRSIGVSNFSVREVKEALDTGFPLVNNQIEYNLNHQPGDILDYCLEHKMTVTAYSPLEHGSRSQEAVLENLAQKYGVAREEVLINWLMTKGMIVVPVRQTSPTSMLISMPFSGN